MKITQRKLSVALAALGTASLLTLGMSTATAASGQTAGARPSTVQSAGSSHLMTGASALAVSGSGGAGTAAAGTATDSYYGCPAGAACLYAQDASKGWDGLDPSRITDIYWSYGAHNLSNKFGLHWLVNNQTPSSSFNAWVETCTEYNGVGCTKQILPRMGIQLDFTPINSIVLDRP